MAERGQKGDIAAEIQEGDNKVEAEEQGKAKAQRLKPASKPDQGKHDAAIEQMQASIKADQAKMNAIQDEIRGKASSGPQAEIKTARDAMRVLRGAKDKLMTERQSLFDQRDAMRAAQDKMVEAGKKMRGDLKFRNADDVNKAIKELEDKHCHTTMTIKEEKIIVKEIEQLKASRKQMERYSRHMDGVTASKKGGAAGGEGGAKGLQEMIGELNGGLREINGKIAAQREILGKYDGENAKLRERIPEMRAQVANLRTKKDATYQEIVAMRAAHRTANDEFFTYKREANKQRAEQRKIEQVEWEAERAKQRAEEAAELATQKPWEEEIALCDFLGSCLKRLDPSAGAAGGVGGESKEEKKEEKASTGRKIEGFANVQAYKKKDTVAEDFAMMGGGKKKGKKGKKGTKKKKSGGVRMDVDMIAQFQLLNLAPPTQMEEIPRALKDLLDMRGYYDVLPRDAEDKNKKKKGKGKKGGAAAKLSVGDAIKTPLGDGSVAVVERADGVITVTLAWGTAYGKF